MVITGGEYKAFTTVLGYEGIGIGAVNITYTQIIWWYPLSFNDSVVLVYH
jgi:hypothetical protein